MSVATQALGDRRHRGRLTEHLERDHRPITMTTGADGPIGRVGSRPPRDQQRRDGGGRSYPSQRRGRDSNPRWTKPPIPVFETGAEVSNRPWNMGIRVGGNETGNGVPSADDGAPGVPAARPGPALLCLPALRSRWRDGEAGRGAAAGSGHVRLPGAGGRLGGPSGLGSDCGGTGAGRGSRRHRGGRAPRRCASHRRA